MSSIESKAVNFINKIVTDTLDRVTALQNTGEQRMCLEAESFGRDARVLLAALLERWPTSLADFKFSLLPVRVFIEPDPEALSWWDRLWKRKVPDRVVFESGVEVFDPNGSLVQTVNYRKRFV